MSDEEYRMKSSRLLLSNCILEVQALNKEVEELKNVTHDFIESMKKIQMELPDLIKNESNSAFENELKKVQALFNSIQPPPKKKWWFK